MAPKSLAVLAGLLLVTSFLLVSSDAAASATEEQQQLLTKNAAAVVGESKIHCHHGCCPWKHGHCVLCCRAPAETTMTSTAAGGVDESKHHHCRCCKFHHGRCQHYCCSNGEVIPLHAEAKAEPRN